MKIEKELEDSINLNDEITLTALDEFLNRRKGPQSGYQIHLEYEYLLNTDIDWILNEIRTAIRDELRERKKDKKVFTVTLDVDKIKTGNSVDFFVFLGITIAPSLIEIHGERIIEIIISSAWNRLKRKGVSRKRRINIRNGSIKRIKKKANGEIEVLEAHGDKITIEE